LIAHRLGGGSGCLPCPQGKQQHGHGRENSYKIKQIQNPCHRWPIFRNNGIIFTIVQMQSYAMPLFEA
ncbi:MAG: hypothetical protein OQK40_04175, partial [Gammaproteobacteria bacterium]|nr:hypothetical protein [Gammaproteobacteria bacterium]